ncbi:hypothetical protein [Pedobacter nutrimenti]|uniref:Uncharacterized protein n=1 Tax=Pedobacter nutrimenti TaxID=1241337 RepID=A0A318UK84_9SPHI|nr:hypothetical protein [Pedobacter nutrimenti]PYF68448.1 hypothetical protein B0O44_11232 [Pedobacter nutrimenti]
MNNFHNDHKDHFNEIFYKNYLIKSHITNVYYKSPDNLILISPINDPDNIFVLGIDHDRMLGDRSVPHNLEDAYSYIDWVTEIKNTISKEKEQ